MAARYWKLSGLSARGGGNLEIAEIALMNGAARIDTGPMISTTVLPVAGVVTALADTLSSGAQWAASALSNAGFAITWDFGSAVDVTSVVITAGATASLFPYSAELYSSTDGMQWVQVFAYEGFAYPGSGATLTVPVVAVGDADWNRVSLLLHADGAPGATSSDSSLFNRTLAFSPSGATITTGQSKFGGSSLNLSGSSSGVTVEHPSFAGDFTFEAWVFPSSPSAGNYCVFAMGGWELYRRNSASQGLSLLGASANRILGATLMTLDTWHHIAWCRINGVHAIYLDGVQQGTYADNTAIIAAPLVIGNYNNSECFKGYVDEVRVTNGVSRYSGNFTPPTLAFPASDMPLSLRKLGVQGASVSITNTLPPPGDATTSVAKPQARMDMQDGGTGTVSGTVKEKNSPANTPLARKVRLFEEVSGRMIRETWSDKTTGNYVFTELNMQQRYTVVAYDYQNNYRAVIADNVSPT